MHFLALRERSTLKRMAQRPKNHVASKPRATDTATAEAASLAAKVSALPSHLEPRAGQCAGTVHSDSPSVGQRALFNRLLNWLVWLVTLSMVIVALMRVFDHDGAHFFIWLNAFTRYVYLPAYACLAYAIWKRHWFLALANIAVVSLHIALLAPDFIRDGRFDSAATGTAVSAEDTPKLRIFFANVRAQNTEHQALLEEIKAANPDVIVRVEFSWPWHLAYLHSSVFAAYPYGGGMENQRMGTVNVFSKIPLKS